MVQEREIASKTCVSVGSPDCGMLWKESARKRQADYSNSLLGNSSVGAYLVCHSIKSSAFTSVTRAPGYAFRNAATA